MKHLEEYLYWFFEDQSNNELRKQIIDYVDPDKEKPEEINNDTLKKAYNVLQSISDVEFKQIKNEFFANNEEGFKEFVNLLEKTGNKVGMLKALLEKHGDASDCFPSFQDLKDNSGKKNLFDIVLNDKFINIFGKKENAQHFLEKLINIKYKDNHDKGVGRGELYLFSLFKNTVNTDKGDVQIDKHNIEVKMSTSNSSNGGKVMASNLKLKSPKDMAKFLEDEYNIKNVRIGPYSVMDSLIKRFDDDEKGFYAILDMILYQFNDWHNDKNLNIIKDFIKTKIDKKNLGKQLIRIHGCLALIEYHDADKWDYLLVGNTSNGNYYMIDGKLLDINNLKESLEYLYNDKHFVFKDGPSNSLGANNRNYVSSIYVSVKNDNFYNN